MTILTQIIALQMLLIPASITLCAALLVSNDRLEHNSLSRRKVLQHVTESLIIGQIATPISAKAEESNKSFDVYRVLPDAESLKPSLQSVDKATFFSQILPTKGGALWLGEHHNSVKDHNLQAEIVETLATSPLGMKISVGLEQVQVKFQPVLDDYISGAISAEKMKKLVEWDKRWIWPFDAYRPVFETAKKYKLPLIALNVNSEDLALVERGGYPGVPKNILSEYIADAQGFAAFAQHREFSTYVDYVIKPSYDMHDAMGLLQYTMAGEKLEEKMSFSNFLSGRLLWDEAMATKAYYWTKKNEGGLLVGLVGADHVKFQNGIPGRFSRMAKNELDCTSVILNPTLIDSRPAGTVGMEGADSNRPDLITLQLRYLKDSIDRNSPERVLPTSTGGVLPLSDYLIIG